MRQTTTLNLFLVLCHTAFRAFICVSHCFYELQGGRLILAKSDCSLALFGTLLRRVKRCFYKIVVGIGLYRWDGDSINFQLAHCMKFQFFEIIGKTEVIIL